MDMQTARQLFVVATVEIADATSSVDLLSFTPEKSCQLRPRIKSPAGYQWFDLAIDEDMGEIMTAKLAGSVLQAMQERADRGQLEGFRIVVGKQWLDLHSRVSSPLKDSAFAQFGDLALG